MVTQRDVAIGLIVLVVGYLVYAYLKGFIGAWLEDRRRGRDG